MHDALGRALKVGDTVMIPAFITEVMVHDDYCNVSLETFIGRRPDGKKERVCAINTGVVVRYGVDFAEDFAPLPAGGATFIGTESDEGDGAS